MTNGQLEQLSHLDKLQKELTDGCIKYWYQYSSFNDWHFWFLVVLSILPLVTLFFLIDRKSLFSLGFFGFAVHILHSYVDIAAVQFGKWVYPHKLIPFYPISFALDASLIPVTFMLVYQWTINRKKNFYLYATIPAFFFAFIAKPILIAMDITKPGKGGGGLKAYVILFISHFIIACVSKLLTDLFRKLQVDEKLNNDSKNLERITSLSWNWFKVREKSK
jgi:hypothetical protein